MIQDLGFDLQEVNNLIVGALSPDKAQSEESSIQLAKYLSDDFADENDQASTFVRNVINATKEKLSPPARTKFDDLINVALARVDPRYSMEYWLRQDDGRPLRLTILQLFWLDFIRYAHYNVQVPIIFAPMGTGKSSIMVGIKAYEIGKNPDILEQLVCSNDGQAELRGLAIQKILDSPHYKKIFPHIRPDPKYKRWGAHELLVQRSQASRTEEVTRESTGDAGSIDMTLRCYGVTSGGLGSRAHRSDFDDLATYTNSIESPSEGKRIYDYLTLTWFTREKSPVGVSDKNYDPRSNPWRGRIIGTPWAHDDPVYRLRDWHGAAVVLIGVNADMTAYNVQIWGLPEHQIEKLRKKYCTGYVKDIEWRLRREETDFEYKLGPGVGKDELNPPKATMELPLSRPRGWYIERWQKAQDPRMHFDRPYRCEVFTEGEKAFPSFMNSVVHYYPETDMPIYVSKEIILSSRSNADEYTGWMARILDPPQDYVSKIAVVDLSGMNRQGTVLMTASLTKDYRKRLDEIVVGGWSADEITDQIDKLFERHPDLDACYVESVSLQSLYVKTLQTERDNRPWSDKIGAFDATTTLKIDEQIGILTLGIPLKNGGFIIPNTMDQERYPDHGRSCICGYCRLIRDGVNQTRLSQIKSDLLVMLWAIHLCFPHSIDLEDSELPTVYHYSESGYELLKNYSPTVLGEIINSGTIANRRPTSSRSTDDGNKEKEQDNEHKDPVNQRLLPFANGRYAVQDEGWK